MKRQHLHGVAGFALAILCGWILVVGCYPGTVAEAGCPGLLGVQGWAANSSQYYYNSPLFTAQELTQINNGIADWTLHNTDGFNCSNVGLYESLAGSYVIDQSNGTAPGNPDYIAGTHIDRVVAGHIAAATTTFFWGLTTVTPLP
jgi:hypothetical protein